MIKILKYIHACIMLHTLFMVYCEEMADDCVKNETFSSLVKPTENQNLVALILDQAINDT